ncbi:MAG: ATP-binding protein [Candidatus Limivicinus sp.]|jgi:signal transduction histidine kinase
MKSAYLRNFVATATMFTLFFLIIASSFVGIGRSYIINEKRSDIYNSAKEASWAATAVSQKDSLSSWALSMTLSTISNSTGTHVLVTDPQGMVVNCSDRVPVGRDLGKVIPQDILDQLVANGSVDQFTEMGGLLEKKNYVVGLPVFSIDKSSILGYAFVCNDEHEMLGQWSRFLGLVAVVTIAVFIAVLMMSYVYSKRMARPLDEMAAASRKFARGDFSVRVRQDDDPTNEIGALVDSFNKMADSLENAEERRSEFIANISHELRTPMTTISGFADGILDGTIPHEMEEKYLRSIRDETRRLSRLVRDMLDISQMKNKAADPSRRTVFDLTELLLQTLLSFEKRATDKNLDVDPQLPDNPLMVRADKDAITQVIYNLLDNAIKFAKEGTCITLRLYKNDGKAYVSIKDCGETIPADDLPFIFDRFHKSDRSRSMDKTGVGLGLYLVKTIINSHDEDIAVKSENNETEFVFTLTLA